MGFLDNLVGGVEKAVTGNPLGIISGIAGLFSKPQQSPAQKMAAQMTQEQAARAQQAYAMYQQALPAVASQYGYNVNFGTPGQGANSANPVTNASVTMDPNWNPLNMPQYANAEANVQAQQSAALRPMLAALAEQRGAGQTGLGASAYNIQRQQAEQNAAFGRQYAGQQIQNRQAFGNQLTGELQGQSALPVSNAAAIGQQQYGAQQAFQGQQQGAYGNLASQIFYGQHGLGPSGQSPTGYGAGGATSEQAATGLASAPSVAAGAAAIPGYFGGS